MKFIQMENFTKHYHTLLGDKKIVFDKILINKELASVWTPYQLYVKEKYIHQGVNSFQVVRTKEGWKIQYLIDTRYP